MIDSSRIRCDFSEPTREEQLFNVRMSTVRYSMEIRNEKGDTSYAGGTAFFVTPTKLLTACHSVLKEGQRVIAQQPGAATVETHDEDIFKKKTRIMRWELEVAKTFFGEKRARWADLAILKTIAFEYTHWVELDFDSKFDAGVQVDIVGYPGSHSDERLMLLHSEINGDNVEKAMADAQTLLPTGQLVISTGQIIQDARNPTYRASTTAGMSGGPVVLNGKAVGTCHIVVA